MDYNDIIQEMVQEMLRGAGSRRMDSEPFSSGEMKMLGSLLLFKDGMTAGELCQTMNVTTPRIAQILNTLEKKGSLYRKADPLDKRIVYAFLTETGRQYARQQYDNFTKLMSRLFDTLGEDETREYLRLSKRVKQIITDMEDNAHE